MTLGAPDLVKEFSAQLGSDSLLAQRRFEIVEKVHLHKVNDALWHLVGGSISVIVAIRIIAARGDFYVDAANLEASRCNLSHPGSRELSGLAIDGLQAHLTVKRADEEGLQ